MQWLKNLLSLNHPDEKELAIVRAETEKLKNEISLLTSNIAKLQLELDEKKKNLITVSEEQLLQEFGLYEPRYQFQTLESFDNRLKDIRKEQKNVIKDNAAVIENTTWTVNGSKREGKKMVSDITKLLIRAFNSECESLIDKVKFNNIESAEQRMRKTFEMINRCGRVLSIHISDKYLDLKLDELHLSYEYAVKKQEEKDLLAEKREQIREEQKALREIAAMKQKIIKEETHFQQAIAEKKKQLYESNDRQIQLTLINKIKELEQKLAELEKDKQDVLNREQNTRAGYVYIISNIGAFGEDVYKIGVTRRLDPTERVRELGDASVPFKFDIHAMIFSEDAPALENELHRTFEDYRLNKLNKRREFFRVPLSEIERVVKHYHAKEIEFQELAYADEFRQSLKMKNSRG